jgi:excisionase family DNA binding protein
VIIIAAAWFLASLFSTGAAEPGFWSTREVAEYLGVPESTVRYWSYMGTGPKSYRIGRRRKYKPAEVEAWAESKSDELFTPSPAPRTRQKTAAKKTTKRTTAKKTARAK